MYSDLNSAGSWWVGLTKRGTHPIWHWLSTGETVSYDNWADDSNEPQTGLARIVLHYGGTVAGNMLTDSVKLDIQQTGKTQEVHLYVNTINICSFYLILYGGSLLILIYTIIMRIAYY